MRDIKGYCIKNNMKFKYCNKVLNDIVSRLDSDKEFKKRQRFVGIISKILKKKLAF